MIARWTTVVLLALSAGALGGCQAIFVALEKIFPKDRVPAKFHLPSGKTVLVFPDDLGNPVSYPPVKRALAEQVAILLKEKKLAADVVPYEKLAELERSEPEFNLMSNPKIGRRLGADLVLHISIEQFTLKDAPVDTLWRGRFAARAKVVDVRKGRLWPDEHAGYPVHVSAPLAESTSEAFGEELAKMLARDLAAEVVGLFHDHYVERSRPKDETSPFDE